jgi:hypothetical protein
MLKMYARLASSLLLLAISSVSFAQKEKEKAVTYDDKQLYGGCWFVPHNAGVNIRFSEFNNFIFADYDNSKGGEIILKGKYLLDGHNMWLIYDDRAKEKFYFYKGEGADDAYYIKGYPLKTSEYYFVHGKCD